MISRTLTYDDLGVTMPEIYEQMGYGAATDADIEDRVGEDVKAEVTSILDEIKCFLQPKLCFYIGKGVLDEEHNTLHTNGRTMNIGKIITRQLKGSSLYAFFVCTAGDAFQQYQERLKAAGDIVREFAANAIGSVLAEKTADAMERELEAFLMDKPELRHTNRFSPGYCGWHVREQKLLFSTFPQISDRTTVEPYNRTTAEPYNRNPCGVRLTDSCLMMPIKSVSGVIGIGEKVRKMEYTCGLCDYAKCYKRRRKSDKL